MAESFAAVNIANNALYRLGEKPIVSFEDNTPKSDLCKALFASNRNILLSWQAWPFATVRQPLARLSATPPSDFTYYYGLPTLPELIRVIDIDLDLRRLEYQREVYVNPADPLQQRGVIATDADAVVMRYVGVTSEAVWSPLFVSTLEIFLAASLAPMITGKASYTQALTLQLYGTGREPGLLQKLRDLAGYEDTPRQMPMPTAYLDVRSALTTGTMRYLEGL